MADAPDIVTTSTRVAYQNRWMRVREDGIRRRDGSESIYGVVEKADFVAVAAIGDGHIHLVEQYRYPARGRFWELPQGAWEQSPDMDMLALAKAELREETGIEAADWLQVGTFYLAYGSATQLCTAFLARGLRRGPRQLDHEEQDLITREVPLDRFLAMLGDGTIKDSTTLATVGLLRLKGLL